MVQRLLPPTPEEEEEQQAPAPEQGLGRTAVPAPQTPTVALPKPHEILKGILEPLSIPNESKTDIWNAVLRPEYKFDHLERLLKLRNFEGVPGAVKTDIWNVKSGRMFPEYPLPTGAAPRPGQIFGEPGLEEPVGPEGQIRQGLPGLMPAEIKMVTDPETGEQIRTRFPTEPGLEGAPLVAPGPDIPPAGYETVPPEAVQVTPRPAWRKLPTPTPPGVIPPTPLETPKIGPDPGRELVTPVLPSGRSPLITMGNRKGRVNFDVPPEVGGTPSPRYAFDTVDGGRWFYQLEKDYQGGRWENADHAEADFEGYKKLPSGARKTQLTRMWQGDAGIVKAIDDAARAGKSFAQLKGDLAPFNTHRQISVDELKTFGFPEMSGELMLGKMEEHYPLPTVIVKEMTPYLPKVDEDLVNRATYGELMDAKLQGPFVRWESHPNAQIMYESLLKLPEEDRSKFIANRWWQQPEVNAAINFAVQYKVPWEDLTDFLAEYDTTPPRQLGPLRVDAPLPQAPNREPTLFPIPWQLQPTIRAALKEYKDLWPEKTEEQLMEEFRYDIGKRSREKNLWEFYSEELFTPGGLYERTPYEAKSVVEFAELTSAFYAVEAGKATDREEQLLIDYYTAMEEAQIRGSTMPYEIARTVSFMPAFMFEILSSGGFYTIAKRSALKTAKNLLLRAMPRMGKRLAQRQAAKKGAKEVTAGFARRSLSYAEDIVGRTTVLFPTRGTVTGFERILHGEDKDLLPAMWHGYLDLSIEIFSELAGDPTGRQLSKVWKKLPIQSKITNLKNALVYRWMGKTGQGAGDYLNLLQRSGYHGVFMELGEEELGRVLRAATQLKPYEMISLRQFIIEATAFSFPGMGALAMQVAERNNRDEQQKLAEDIEFFGELATQGLTVEQIYARAPKQIKAAIDKALAQGETLEDLIDADQNVQTPVHGMRDIPKDSVILLPGIKQPRGGEEERRWNAYWKTQVDVDALPMSDEDKVALRTEGTKRDAQSVNEGFTAAKEIIDAYEKDSPEQNYAVAYANWRMGEDMPFPGRGKDEATPFFGIDQEQVRVIQEDMDRIADELDLAPWRAPRSEEQAAADPLPPHIQDLVDSLPEDQRAEAAINPGYFSEVTTGEQFAATAYRGEGATLEEIYGPGSVERGIAVDLAGPGQYYSFHPEHAKRYGDNVTEVEVDLNNPLVIDNDQQWFEILAAAGAAHLSPVTFVSQAEPTGRAAAAAALQAWIREQGHDGIIVKVPEMSDESLEGLPAARLRDSWEHSQVVVFDIEAPKVEPGEVPPEKAPPEEAPRRPETGNQGLLKLEGLKYIETLTTDEERDYATKFLNFKLGLEPDPGKSLPIHIVGMIRLEIEAIATRVGLKPPTEIPPTELPATPEQAAPVPAARAPITPDQTAKLKVLGYDDNGIADIKYEANAAAVIEKNQTAMQRTDQTIRESLGFGPVRVEGAQTAEEIWAEHKKKGATDAELKAIINGYYAGAGNSSSGGLGFSYQASESDGTPSIWIGTEATRKTPRDVPNYGDLTREERRSLHEEGDPTLSGQELIDKVRQVFDIPKPGEVEVEVLPPEGAKPDYPEGYVPPPQTTPEEIDRREKILTKLRAWRKDPNRKANEAPGFMVSIIEINDEVFSAVMNEKGTIGWTSETFASGMTPTQLRPGIEEAELHARDHIDNLIDMGLQPLSSFWDEVPAGPDGVASGAILRPGQEIPPGGVAGPGALPPTPEGAAPGPEVPPEVIVPPEVEVLPPGKTREELLAKSPFRTYMDNLPVGTKFTLTKADIPEQRQWWFDLSVEWEKVEAKPEEEQYPFEIMFNMPVVWRDVNRPIHMTTSQVFEPIGLEKMKELLEGREVEVLPPEKAEGLPAGLVSDYLDGLPPGTTFTLTEGDVPEISQLEGQSQVALDREKFFGTWKRGLADIEIPGAGPRVGGQALALRWINSETGLALASRDFEPLGSTRMTAAIGRSMVEEKRKEAGPAPTELPPTPETAPGPEPSRTLRIGRGANGQVVVVFQHKDDADLFSAVGRMRRKAQGKEGPRGPSWERLRELYPAGAVNIGSFSQDYRDQIMEAIKGLPEGDTFQAPRPTHFTVTPQEELPPTPEGLIRSTFDAKMDLYPEGTKFTITTDAPGTGRFRVETDADVKTIMGEDYDAYLGKQQTIGEWVKVPEGWEKISGTPLDTVGPMPSVDFVDALGEEVMSSVLKRNGLMGLLTGDFIFDKEPTPTDEAATPEEAASPHMTVALAVRDLLEAGESIDNPTLTKIANEAFGGTRGEGAYDPRDAYDAAEVGLNMVFRRAGEPLAVLEQLVDFEDSQETVAQMRRLMALMPRQSDRTDEAVEMQQFSTPPELAFIAAYLSAGWRSGSTNWRPILEGLEPSAGTGSIATMMQLGGMKVTANETAPRRAQLLRDQGFETTEHDAEFLHSVMPIEIQPDIIVMNPPFSATGGRTVSHATKYGAKHLKEALARLREGGRLVAIVGQGMAYNRPAFSEWWNRIADQYNIRANVGISGKHYGKWGTNFGQQLLIIDKTGPTPGNTVAERVESIIIGEDLTPEEALELLDPLAWEEISGRLAERPTEEGVRGPEGAIPPGPGAGIQPPPDTPVERPERGPERVDKPTPGVGGPTERPELGGVDPGAGAVPGPGPGGPGAGYGEGGRGGPGGPGGAPGVGGLPGGGDLGRTGPSPGLEEGPEFGATNTVFKKDEAEEALERLRKRIKSQLDVGLDPDMMKDMFKVGGALFEGGLRRFADWSKKMIDLLGETVRSVLQSVFDTVKGFYESSSQEKGAQYTKENRQSVVDEIAPFSQYTVRKANFEGSQPHPANIVESSILASVEPPDSTYVPDIPSEVITEGRLSDLQMEAVSYIGQRHETVFVDGTRAGFWLGDGTGLGKGREIVGAIWDNWNKGRRRAVWISVNHVLGSDAERDVVDMGAPMKVLRQKENKYKAGKPIDDQDGILFSAYSMVSYRIRGQRQRFNQMIDWMGPDFDGVIAFDESHLLKNALKGDRSGTGIEQEGGTQSGRMAAMLEEMYPKARFIYVSATGATVPRNMGYMTRLGLWGAGRPFPQFIDFLNAMQRGGLGAMEMLSRDLKAIGSYMSRIISYEGVGYDTITHELTPMEIDSYNKAADIWQELITEFEAAQANANQPRSAGGVWSAFYGGEQRFFLQYMMSLKLPDLFAAATKDLALGRTVVINLFNTNEEMTDRMVKAAKAEGISIDELDFTPKQMIIDLINRYFPLIEYVDTIDPQTGAQIKVIKYQKDKDGNTTDQPVINRENLEKQAELLEKLADVNFPDNPMDKIVEHFGVENISEVSGRTKRLVRGEHVIRKVKGVKRDELNEYETANLQDGTNRIAVITGSAATGISMHSDLSKKNQQQRVFYAFQLNWSADKQLQSFGRVHRSNQDSAPIYKLLRTNLKSEERIVNATSRRLAGLGALTTGSREALAGGLFEIEDLTDVYGESALVVTYDDIMRDRVEGIEGGPELVGIMGMLDGNGNVDRQHSSNVNRFLNRIMALHVDVQNAVFNRFYDHYQRIVQMAKDEGSFDRGIQPIRDRNFNKPIGVTVKKKPNNPETVHVDQDSGAKTELIDLIATYPVQKLTYEDAQKMGGTANRGFVVNVRSKKIYTVYPTDKTKYSAEAVRKGFPGTQPLFALTNPKGLTHEVPEFQLSEGQNFQDPLVFQQTQAAAEAMRRRQARKAELATSRQEQEKERAKPIKPGENVIYLGSQFKVLEWFLEDGVDMVSLEKPKGQWGPLEGWDPGQEIKNVPVSEVSRRETRDRPPFKEGERVIYKGEEYHVQGPVNEEGFIALEATKVYPTFENVPVELVDRPGEQSIPDTPEPSEIIGVGEKVIYKDQETTVLRTWTDNQGIPMVDIEEGALGLTTGTGAFPNVPSISVPRSEVTRVGDAAGKAAAILTNQQMWEAELTLLGDTDQVTVTMLIGAVIPVYDKVIGSGDTALRRLRVVRTVLDDGTAYVGMHIMPNEVGSLKERLGIGTPLGAATAQEIYEMVEGGAVIELDNGWRLRMTKVHREAVMELDTRGKYHKDELISYGMIMEILQAKRRFFVPLDATEGPKAIGAMLELHKAVRNITTESGGGNIPGPGVGGDPGVAGDAMDAGDLALPGDTVAGTSGSADELTDFDQGEYNEAYTRTASQAQGIPETPDERRAREADPVRGQVPDAEFTAAEARAAKLPGNVPINVLAEKMGISYRDARDYVAPIDAPVILDAFPDDIPADMFPDADDPIHAGGSEREMTMSREPKPGWFEDGLHISYPDVYEAYEQILIALGKNVPIRIGRFKNKARGIFKIFTEVIRLNKADNIPTAAHEIGHAIEKAVYGWSRSGGPSPFTLLSPGIFVELREMGKALYGARRPNAGYDREGWAEFMRYYLTGDLAEEKAPRTYRWFTDTFLKDNPDILESLNKAKELTTKYRLQGTKLRLRGGIKWGQDKSNRFLTMMRDMSYKTWVEMLSPLEHMSAVAERLLGQPLREEEDPYLTARSRRLTAGGKVNTMVHRSMIDIAGNKVGPPLNDMEALVKGQQEEFAWYLWGRRAQERWRDHNKDPGMSLADADWIVEELETPEFLLAAQMFYDWNKSLMNYARQGGLLNKKAYDAILEGSHDYMPLYRVFDEVDPEFTKEFSGRGRMGGGNAFPFMKGKRGGRIRDPFTVAVERARRIILQTDQRIVLMQIMRMGADPWMADGMGIEIEEVARPNVPIPVSIEQTLRQLLKEAISAEQKKLINQLLSGGVQQAIAGAESMDELVIKLKKEFAELGILSEMLTFFVPAQRPKGSEADPIVPITDKDGKIRWFQVPNDLYKLLEGLDIYRLGSTLDLILGSPTRAMRMTTTALRPVFALWRNPIKDLQTFIMHTQSDKKPHMLVAEWLTTMADIVRNGEDSPYFAQFLRFGLEAGTQLGQDIRQTKRAVEGLFQGKWVRKMHSPLDAYRDLMSIPEMGTRVTELRLMAEKVGWKPGEQMTFNQSIQLMNASKLASVDFTAAGSMGRKFNQAIPFFNANIQGNRQFYENMRDRPRRTILRGLSVFTIPTLILWWINKDEEWYRDMPWWERFTYWNIGKLKVPFIGKGKWELDILEPLQGEFDLPYIYQIPRAFEWGAAFSALPEALFDAVYEVDPVGMKKVFGHIFDVVVPQNLPPTAEIPIEIAVNMDSWTMNRIIPQAETRYPASEQKGKYTSRLATYLARIFPEITYQLGITEQPEIPGRMLGKIGSPRVWDHAIRGFFGGVGPELLDTVGLGTRPFGGNLRDALMGPNDDSLPVASWLFWMTRRGGKKAGRSQTIDDFYEEWARVNKNYENGQVKAYALGEKSEVEQQRFSARYQWPETPERRRYRLQLNDAEAAMQVLNLLERNITNYKELEVTRQIQVGIAREALDHPKVPMNQWETEVYEAEIRSMPLREKTRIMTAAYIRANTVGNDPESIWGTAAALGIPRDEVARLIDNTTTRIMLLQIDKNHPDATAEQVEEIEEQIRQLHDRRLLERFQATPIRARFPDVPPDRLPPTP